MSWSLVSGTAAVICATAIGSAQTIAPRIAKERQAVLRADYEQGVEKGRFVLSPDAAEYRLDKPIKIGGRSPASDAKPFSVSYQVGTAADGKRVFASIEVPASMARDVDLSTVLNEAEPKLPATAAGSTVQACNGERVCEVTGPGPDGQMTCLKWKCK